MQTQILEQKVYIIIKQSGTLWVKITVSKFVKIFGINKMEKWKELELLKYD